MKLDTIVRVDPQSASAAFLSESDLAETGRVIACPFNFPTPPAVWVHWFSNGLETAEVERDLIEVQP